MEIMEYFSNSDLDDNALVIRCLLDRIPILVTGKDEQEIENFLNELSQLLPFRNIMIYYTEFVDKDDYERMLEMEQLDFEIQRNIFVCYPFAVEKLIQDYGDIKSWIVGCSHNIDNQMLFAKLSEYAFKNNDFYLLVILNSNSIKSEIHGKTFPKINLHFERWLFETTLRRTENSIEKMKRVISKRIKTRKIEQEYLENLMNFSFEEIELKNNIIKKEITNFFEASKRSFNVLNRINTLKLIGYHASVSNKTLENTIAYKDANIQRIMDFIQSEWLVNYKPYLENKKMSNFTDTFESLWG